MVSHKLDAKTIYAQSSDIKSRTYLEYRKDMKKKAIAELEVLEWLEYKIKDLYKKKEVKVYKSGGDRSLWFLRKGGVTREPDFIAEIGDRRIEIEFQYADKKELNFYDFKVSKVVKKKGTKQEAIKNKIFIYIHKPTYRYGIFKPEWILKNGEYGMVEAWRSYAYRVPKEKFERILKEDDSLEPLCRKIDMKNFILNFQHELIQINKEKLSHLLQKVVDDQEIVKFIPKDLDSFFKICFILDNINKVPSNANLWLVYLLSYVNDKLNLEKVSQIVYCVDFLYSKIELKENELNLLASKIKELLKLINNYARKDGSYVSSIKVSPLDETRYALFSINLIEDLIQDMIFYYGCSEFNPIKKIYENIVNLDRTFVFLNNNISGFVNKE